MPSFTGVTLTFHPPAASGFEVHVTIFPLALHESITFLAFFAFAEARYAW